VQDRVTARVDDRPGPAAAGTGRSDATAAEARMLAHLEGVRGPAGARARPAAEGASCDPPEELT